MEYRLSKEERQQYGSIILLNQMINLQNYSIIPKKSEKYLEPLFALLNKADFIKVDADKYVPTKKGRDHLLNFYKKYWDFIRIYDLFCAVDLNEGTFAFDKFFELGDEEWYEYLNQENWEDVRIAICEFKKINPIEVVFMSFLNEGKFDLEKDGWEFDLTSGLIWDQIEHVCNNNLTVSQLEENGTDVGVMVEMGAQLAKKLYEDEKRRNEELANQEDEFEDDGEEYEEEYIEETVTYVEVIEEDIDYYDDYYYDLYLDPYYVPDYWLYPVVYIY